MIGLLTRGVRHSISSTKSIHVYVYVYSVTLREKCPYLELFRSAFLRVQDQTNSEYGHFLRSVMHFVWSLRRPIWFLHHCVKSGQIRSYFWSVFSCFGPNTGKYRPEITPYLDTFHSVHFTYIWIIFRKSFYCFDNLIYLTTSEYFIVSMKFTQLSLDFCFKTLNVDNLKIFVKNQHFIAHNCSKV